MFSELLRELMESKKKCYLADSIDAPEVMAYEQDQLDQLLSESIELDHNLFTEMCDVLAEHNDIPDASYGYSEDDDICWVYDPTTSIHYFYR